MSVGGRAETSVVVVFSEYFKVTLHILACATWLGGSQAFVHMRKSLDACE